MTGTRLSLVRLLAAAVFALLCLMIPLDAGAQATTPGAPVIDKVTARAGWLLVQWEAPTNDGGSEITACDLRHIETSEDETVDANWTEVENVWPTADGELEYGLRGLTNGTEYDVQVRAVNANGDGDWSATVTGTPELSEKTRATIVAVRGDDGAVAVTWNAPTEVVDPITVYHVRYILTSADESVDTNWTVYDDAWTVGRQEYGITGLTNGVAYDVQVRAVDSYGDGAWSATASATPADFADALADAGELTLQTESSGKLHPLGSLRYWGKIDPSSDEDYFKLVLTDTQVPVDVGFWIYTLGDLDTVGELLDDAGETIESDDFGGVLPNPENFFIWRTLKAGTYYIQGAHLRRHHRQVQCDGIEAGRVSQRHD